MRRPAETREIAQGVLFLCAPESAYITGTACPSTAAGPPASHAISEEGVMAVSIASRRKARPESSAWAQARGAGHALRADAASEEIRARGPEGLPRRRDAGFLHLYIGEEAVATGVCAHLKPTDWVTSTHRGHGHALAKGMDPNILMAELYGKRDGCCGGRGGTMHLYDAKTGLFGTNGSLAAASPSAVGAAISARHRGTDGVAIAFSATAPAITRPSTRA